MPEFLYRFRSIDRLLGKNELAEHYIYFASPEQLNDPFEGYRELFFAGDEVVWRNLFRRYIACLIFRNYQYLSNLDLDEIDFPDVYDSDEFPSALIEPGNKAISEFLSNGNVKRHIEFLASAQRKILKEELTVHLSAIQVYAMKLVADLFAGVGVKTIESPLTSMSLESSLQFSNEFLSMCEDAGASNEATGEAANYAAALYMSEANMFLVNYKAYKAERANQNWRTLVHGYVAQFIESLKELSHRDWYTACFMEACSSSALWGSYGDNHKGVCLKFKASVESGVSKLPLTMPVGYSIEGSIWESAFLAFEKVIYESEIQYLDFFRNIGNYPRNKLYKNWYLDEGGRKSICSSVIEVEESNWVDVYWKKRQLSITTKMIDWQGENEFRLILQNAIPGHKDPKNRCLKYDFESLDGLIFGIRTPEIDKYRIIQVIEELCDKYRRTDFNIYQAYHDSVNKKIAYRFLLNVSCDPELSETSREGKQKG
ncbi:DUF2971 domain-containing protein [Pseudomonas mediterranea]|uniref:DUF2971 domain-containing protein n=1 Tax=Pseudomonas mediterranea TaxID=183795 RepID=UPI003BF58CD1